MTLRTRQPVHVLYGGGHLFQSKVSQKMGQIALRFLERHLPDSRSLAAIFGISNSLAATVHPLLRQKLETEPVEEVRIDFEDGYGSRSDSEEDAHAQAAARCLDSDSLPPFLGLRIKALRGTTERRGLRTLERFFSAAPKLPSGFVVTLPKIVSPLEVERLLNHVPPEVGVELMIETIEALDCLPELLQAGRGRITAAHFGPYDFLSSCGIAVVRESLQHPICVAARTKILFAYARTGIHLSDGPTRDLPFGDFPDRALALHFQNVQQAMNMGFYQGWDLHPAQIPARHAAVIAFFHDGLPEHRARLLNFLESSAQATRLDKEFDDAATALGLLKFFRRAVDCGAIDAKEVGVSLSEAEAILRV